MQILGSASATVIFLLPLVSAHFEVRSPARLVGSYVDSATAFAPELYEITHLVALATSCPCDWLSTASSSTASSDLALQNWLVLLPTAICEPDCSSELAACAATLYNASGLLISSRFNQPAEPPPGPPNAPSAPPPPPPTEAMVELLRAGRKNYAKDAVRLGCSVTVPASIITSNMSSVLASAGSWDSTLLPSSLANTPASNASTVLRMAPDSPDTINITIRRLEDENLVDCRKYAHAPLVYAVTVPIWLALTVAWTWNTYYRNAAYARDLHRLMCWVPVMEFVHGLLSLFNYYSCPWTSILALVYATFWSIVTILKEPVMLLCLLLVAKGWCITRHFLQRREVCVAGSILALLYASVSVQMSLQTQLAMIPMVVMYVAILIEISWSIVNNLRILKAQLLALRALGVDPTTTPALTKYRMFVRLAWATFAYAGLELAIHWYFSDGRFADDFWFFLAVHQAMELLVAVSIGYTFRAQPFTVLFTQVQQVAAELADQMLPSITTIEVKTEMLQGDNLIAWRSDLGLDPSGSPQGSLRANSSAPPTLVILNPGDSEVEPPVKVSSNGNRAADAAVHVRALTTMSALTAQGASAALPWPAGNPAAAIARPGSRQNQRSVSQRSVAVIAPVEEAAASVEMHGTPLGGRSAGGRAPPGAPPAGMPPTSPGVSPPPPELVEPEEEATTQPMGAASVGDDAQVGEMEAPRRC